MKLLDKLFGQRLGGHQPDEDPEPMTSYGTETIEETEEIPLATVEVTLKSGRTVKKEGLLKRNFYEDEYLEIREVSFKDHRIHNDDLIAERVENEIFRVRGSEYEFYEVVGRKTLRVEAEAEVNYKQVGDQDKEYTSIKSSSIEKEVIE